MSTQHGLSESFRLFRSDWELICFVFPFAANVPSPASRESHGRLSSAIRMGNRAIMTVRSNTSKTVADSRMPRSCKGRSRQTRRPAQSPTSNPNHTGSPGTNVFSLTLARINGCRHQQASQGFPETRQGHPTNNDDQHHLTMPALNSRIPETPAPFSVLCDNLEVRWKDTGTQGVARDAREARKRLLDCRTLGLRSLTRKDLSRALERRIEPRETRHRHIQYSEYQQRAAWHGFGGSEHHRKTSAARVILLLIESESLLVKNLQSSSSRSI